MSIHLYHGSHVGGQKNGHQPIFPYDIIENSPTSLAHNSVFKGPDNFKFGTETHCMVLQAISNFVQIDHTLHNYVFDDVMCKSPIAG